eukprot:Gb_12973 [translate_table: standard]
MNMSRIYEKRSMSSVLEAFKGLLEPFIVLGDGQMTFEFIVALEQAIMLISARTAQEQSEGSGDQEPKCKRVWQERKLLQTQAVEECADTGLWTKFAYDDLTDIGMALYDLVDLTRQALAKLANQIYLNVITAFILKDVHEVAVQSQKFLDLITDMDILLASDDNFLLGPWLESAKKLADNPRERKQYEWNARTQITMWFDNTELKQSPLHDYANKYWSGLLKNYYLPRASIYFNFLLESLKDNKAFPLNMWRQNWIMFSNKWQEGTDVYSVKAEGNALNISRALFQKYFEGLKI